MTLSLGDDFSEFKRTEGEICFLNIVLGINYFFLPCLITKSKRNSICCINSLYHPQPSMQGMTISVHSSSL